MPSKCTLLKVYWRSIVLLLVPLVFAILPILIPTKEAKCAYVMMIMAFFWMTEAIPLAVTALIPVFAFPFLGILQTSEVTRVYMKENIMMFLGGLTMAIAVEHCNLHKRIALFVILHVGQSPRRLMAGFMLTTSFLSMWISNTATTAMMVRVVDAILVELCNSRDKTEDINSTSMELGVTSPQQGQVERGVENGGFVVDDSSERQISKREQSNPKSQEPVIKPTSIVNMPLNEESRALKDMCFLATAYSANIGGTGSMTGTGPNLVIKGILSSSFSEPTGLNFATWLAFNIPGMIICLIFAWLWLQFLFMGLCRKGRTVQETTPERQAAVKRIISEQYKELGPMTHQESTVLSLFIILVFLWLFRSPEFVPGWSKWFTNAYGRDFQIQEASPAMFIVCLLFALPAKLDFLRSRDPENKEDPTSSPACLNWQVLHDKIPWGIVLLMGGGLALAEGCNASGLSNWMGIQLVVFKVMPKEAIVFCICLIIAMLTEVASNTATASIFLPILREMALNIGVNPLYLMLPATICCSYAFMLPVATPPNAIVFSAANMKSIDMMKAGFLMNVICVIVITVMINTLGVSLFDLHSMPPWTNSTIQGS